MSDVLISRARLAVILRSASSDLASLATAYECGPYLMAPSRAATQLARLSSDLTKAQLTLEMVAAGKPEASLEAAVNLPGRAIDPLFEFGLEQRVRKVGGSYRANGTIKARFFALDGASRYVFEFENPKGLLHIFGAKQLEGGWSDE